MPYVRRKKTVRRRKVRRPARRAYKSTKIVTSRTPRHIATLWPDAFECRLRYSVLLDLGTGGAAVYASFRGNGPYDPETASGGNVALGFTQFAAIYYQHFVKGSSCSVRVLQGSSPAASAVTLYPTSIAGTTADDSAQPGAKTRVLPGDTSGKCYIRSYHTTNKIFGHDVRKDSDYFGGSTVVPSVNWYWHIRSDSADGTTAINAYAVVDLVYYTTFFNRIKLSQ